MRYDLISLYKLNYFSMIMFFYILKVKGEGCSLSITAQEWGKR